MPDYRLIDDKHGFEAVVDIEIAVWGLEARDAVPASLMRAVTHSGGMVAGAYQGETLVGMTLAHPALMDRRLVLWSHMTGVLPAAQSNGIGEGLKRFQYHWARKHGYTEIRWTFDPLRRGNAVFNLNRLGAVADRYHVDFYGVMTDALNAGMPSDRLEAVWQIDPPPRPVESNSTVPPLLITSQQDGSPIFNTSMIENANGYLIPIPNTLEGMTTDVILQWRHAMRAAFTFALERHFTVTDFITPESSASNKLHAYVLSA